MTARQELILGTPWLNAAGFGGFSPGPWQMEETQGMFFTNPISLKPRPYSTHALTIAFEGGFLFANGSPNPGLARVLKEYARGWRQSKTPICIHIQPADPDQAAEMARSIEAQDCAAAIELESPPGCRMEEWPAFWEAAGGELPLIAWLPLGDLGSQLWSAKAATLVDAVAIGGPDGMTLDERGVLRSGRMYGPAVLPQMLAALSNLKHFGIPLIASGGIFRMADAEAALKAGATAVQLDAILWRPGGWKTPNPTLP
jgi:dihydroorotate dehydrogenase